MVGSAGSVSSRSLASLDVEATRALAVELGKEGHELQRVVEDFRAHNPGASEKQVTAFTTSTVAQAYAESMRQRHQAMAVSDEQRDQAEASGTVKPRSVAKKLRDQEIRSAMHLRDELKLTELYRQAAEARLAANAEAGDERY